MTVYAKVAENFVKLTTQVTEDQTFRVVLMNVLEILAVIMVGVGQLYLLQKMNSNKRMIM